MCVYLIVYDLGSTTLRRPGQDQGCCYSKIRTVACKESYLTFHVIAGNLKEMLFVSDCR